ncbi:ABC transporter [Leucobacter sp. USHLN153]|uniref:ABC transporter n=1 Tax=Leucobacter sp. USHLN153 TaxID=3081268 RepID=UPI003019521B
MRSRITPLALLGAVTLTLTLVSCSSSAPESTDDAGATGDGHGAVAGAAEVAEPQLALTAISPDGGVSHLDLLDESTTDLGQIGAPSAMTTDGRYLFAETAEGIDIVDSGVWTWDHVDHFHYYRADPRLVGVVDGAGPTAVATTNLSTTGGTGIFFEDSGDAVLLDTEALSKGEVKERFRLEGDPHHGLVVPVGSFALVSVADDGVGTKVVGHTSDGEPAGVEAECLNPAGTVATRVGAVIGCEGGALLASVEGDQLIIEEIPYPRGTTAPRAMHFDNREGRPTVAALAGDKGIWMLDTRERAWTFLPAPTSLVHVTAVDDEDDSTLALAADGRVLVLDNAGAVIAETEPLVSDSLAAGASPTLIADQQRAYLSAPAEKRLYEIDYSDGARIARTFDTTAEPMFVAETGR